MVPSNTVAPWVIGVANTQTSDSSSLVRLFEDFDTLIQLRPNASDSEIDLVIQAVYRQVSGNVHVMDSERFVSSESLLRQGTLSVREFVRAVAKSQLYCDRFVEACSRTRTIEMNLSIWDEPRAVTKRLDESTTKVGLRLKLILILRVKNINRCLARIVSLTIEGTPPKQSRVLLPSSIG